MGEPRYRPKDFCDQPEDFGRSPGASFGALELPPIPRQTHATPAQRRRRLDLVANARAARHQHLHSIAIRERLARENMTLDSYANLLGESARRIGAVLRGDVVMRLDDIERADQVLCAVHLRVAMSERRQKLLEVQALIQSICRDSKQEAMATALSNGPGAVIQS